MLFYVAPAWQAAPMMAQFHRQAAEQEPTKQQGTKCASPRAVTSSLPQKWEQLLHVSPSYSEGKFFKQNHSIICVLGADFLVQ